MIKYSSKCLKCPYYLGIIKCVVSPCTNCKGKQLIFAKPATESRKVNGPLSKIGDKIKHKKK